ncbi:NAD(P)H-dependent oxidoreductase [Amycolatopsis circi]|uniref:NAD(P)H-dependent oxidoreductase n=1 Tax=Amycolatopsis circi TaxID=871959 RepID=UPI000E233C67|nr:NAD(P)H-dependent oxidoreductase [Amycolatopsis circi]
MRILHVWAHPEPRSLNGSIATAIQKTLTDLGHQVDTSDLYRMKWKPQLDQDDFDVPDSATAFHPEKTSREAFLSGWQSADIETEQRKLVQCDALVLQFPLWWYSMPAIMKGWFERIYAYGFAYGVGEHSDTHWGDRFGEGAMSGKRAMTVVTTGGWESHYSGRGVNGPIEDLLFPIHHGLLFYTGFDVLPPFLVHRTSKVDAECFDDLSHRLNRRLENLFTTPPIPYRPQNGGDYTIPALELRDGFEPGHTGFGIHRTE